MNQAEEAKLLEQLEQWNKKDEYSRCIRAIEAILEQERGYLLTVKLSRAYSNLAVLGDHRAHGTDGAVDGALIRHAIDLLESVRTQGENAPYWNARMGYSCLMAYPSAATAYEYAKRWLALALEDPDAQKLVRNCEEYLEEYLALDCYFSVGPDAWWNPAVAQAARRVPRDRILVETDGLGAVQWAYENGPEDGKRTAPGTVSEALENTVRTMAEIRAVSLKAMEELVFDNLVRGFLGELYCL
mgnify:CR=1 FL=1